ncbi:sucrose-phosphate phosphatase [Anabaena sp. FACHB-1237]|uniref:sucrose-phosphate phosphatase n=1 Tax=Anabaena sp. FACHB-1237 TaxID=2692769 RepID=UPI0016816F60|nr:sucrose-phosphate phosphatase [Anabaena sp. FACHB-1237]MBD2136264.1 sucrose-phosphate phosphatase [Anabaena sp. FACHB-1237]
MQQFLFITDLDNTLVGDDAAMVKLMERLVEHRQKYGTKIIYSTGRSLFLYKELKEEKQLPEPDILVCAVGTEIYTNNHINQNWSKKLSPNWHRDIVEKIAKSFPELEPQPNSEQGDFKLSYYLKEKLATTIVPELEQQLQAAQLDIQVIYSGSKDLDILPRNANKGMAMTFVRETLEIAVEKTVACGDSGNDIALFAGRKEKGIIVGNATKELLAWHHNNHSVNRYLATGKCAAGIDEGLQFFGFL